MLSSARWRHGSRNRPLLQKMDNPTVSVCIPTFNHEQYIAQAVESVLAQRTNFPVEILIGEDCSTDRTREIVVEFKRRHPDRIDLRLAETNQGGGRNFCDLFARSGGQYVIILEGDDYWTAPHKLQTQVDALDAHPEWAMCFHPARTVYDDGRPEHFYPEEQPKDVSTIYDLFVKDFMATSSVLFRNRLFKKLPDWFPDIIVGDWALHILNAEHGTIGFLPEPMSVYRVHQGGVFSCKSVEYKIVTIFKMLTKIDHFLGGKYTQEIEENRLNTVRWLVGQMENEARLAKEAAMQAENLTVKRARVEKQAAALQQAVTQLQMQTSRLRNDLVEKEAYTDYLESEREQLLQEMKKLKSFHESWHGSVWYRIYRETIRPWRQLQRRLGKRAEPADRQKFPRVPPSQNAA